MHAWASGRDREAGRRETETADRGGRHGQQDRQVGQGEVGTACQDKGKGVLAIQLLGWAEGLADMVEKGCRQAQWTVIKSGWAECRKGRERQKDGLVKSVVEAEWADGQNEWRL